MSPAPISAPAPTDVSVRAALSLARTAGVAEAGAALAPLWMALTPVLDLTASERATAERAALRLLESARRRWPTREANILFGVQALITEDRRDEPYEYAEWLRTLGRVPYDRSRPLMRQVMKFRRLTAIAARLRRVARAADETALAELLERRRDRLRNEAFEVIADRVGEAIETVSLVGDSTAGRDVVEALQHRVDRWGATDLSDLRDAVAKHGLKMADLQVFELFGEDALLRLDSRLARALDGVHHRGETYLRLFHRIQSLLFGTGVGRLLSRYLLGPFALSAIILNFGEYVAEQFVDEVNVATLTNTTWLAGGLSVLMNVWLLWRRHRGRGAQAAGASSGPPSGDASKPSWTARAWRQIREAYTEVMEGVMASLYLIDDRLRLRQARQRGGRMLAGRGLLGLSYVTYFARFAFRLVIEPTINPVKHIPVVTVAGKISIASGLPVFLIRSMDATLPSGVAWALGSLISIVFLPGLTGFLAWEMRYNWRLYAANVRRPSADPRDARPDVE